VSSNRQTGQPSSNRSATKGMFSSLSNGNPNAIQSNLPAM
jgi:hypothetical protein